MNNDWWDYLGTEQKSDELYHYGRLGMKWGRHIFQKRNGSMSRVGKWRYNRQMKKLKKQETVLKNKKQTQAKLDKLEAKRKSVEELKKSSSSSSSKPKTKTIAELSDTELRERVNRLQLEKQYKDLTPKQKSKGEKFVDSVMKDVVSPSLKAAGKSLLTKALMKEGSKLFGMSEKETKSVINNVKKEAKKAANSIKPETTKSRSKNESSTEDSKTYTGKVLYRKGTSTRESSTKHDPVIYGDWREVPVNQTSSSINNDSVRLGQRYIAGLLEESKRN